MTVLSENSVASTKGDNLIATIAAAARLSSRAAAAASTADKNNALLASADAIEKNQDQLLEANRQDMDSSRAQNLSAELLERLEFNEKRVGETVSGLRQLAQLADPVGAMGESKVQPSGIRVAKMRVPLGVIAVIYESRPGVTADAAGLCLKAGNAVILRGGSEALRSNQIIATCMRAGLNAAGLPADIVQLVPSTDRALVGDLLTRDAEIDVVIPRGGRSLIERVKQTATIPVIKHLDGICHVYVDDDAELDMAAQIAINSKTHRYGVCNAMETLLLHKDLPVAWQKELALSFGRHNVELRVCPALASILDGLAGVNATAANELDWRTEYLAPILAMRQVDSLDSAIEHIALYGSGHTDSIVTRNIAHAEKFVSAVDSSSVMVNTSTRFADGFQYGLGAEIGISTDRLHVRGPVGLEGLTTEKYVVSSSGAVRH